MGDELQRRQAQSADSYQALLRDTSPQSLANSSSQQALLQDMEVAQYPQQQFLSVGHPGVTSMDMRNLAGALSTFQQESFQQQYTAQVFSNHPSQYHFQQGQQSAGQTEGNFHPNFAQQYPSQYFQPQTQQTSVQGIPHNFQNQALPTNRPQYLQLTSYNTRMNSYQGPQLRINAVPGMLMNQQYHPQRESNVAHWQNCILAKEEVRRASSNSSLQASVLRGPPRKPRQSGHALWVGNLPPGTHIVDLKDHFSRDAINDIESVFLISKSNCAFVNYKTEPSCAAAMARFHDSRFQGVRLVCRLRRGSNSGSGTPQVTSTVSISPQSTVVFAAKPLAEGSVSEHQAANVEPPPETEILGQVKEKFFVVKSLTVEDLERSVATGVWATQAHNEDGLNKAYQTAESVYLIFSANKSGEYFGYARMDSAIDDEASSKLKVPMRPETSIEPSMSDLPLMIPTPATATAPKGRIIDDSARGTIFWEADNEDEKGPGNISGEGYESGVSAGGVSPAALQTLGKPFKIVWISTDKLPFYRTRGLHNPWNANREVKIARDGTEIEPGMGRRLTSMFHKPQVASNSPVSARQPSGMMAQGGYMSQPVQMPGDPYGRSC